MQKSIIFLLSFFCISVAFAQQSNNMDVVRKVLKQEIDQMPGQTAVCYDVSAIGLGAHKLVKKSVTTKDIKITLKDEINKSPETVAASFFDLVIDGYIVDFRESPSLSQNIISSWHFNQCVTMLHSMAFSTQFVTPQLKDSAKRLAYCDLPGIAVFDCVETNYKKKLKEVNPSDVYKH